MPCLHYKPASLYTGLRNYTFAGFPKFFPSCKIEMEILTSIPDHPVCGLGTMRNLMSSTRLSSATK